MPKTDILSGSIGGLLIGIASAVLLLQRNKIMGACESQEEK
jgi:hypothetical protein